MHKMARRHHPRKTLIMNFQSLALASCLLLSACANQPSAVSPESLDSDHFKTNTTMSDKDQQRRITTEKGYEEPYEGPSHFESTYLVASIDQATGKVAYAVTIMRAVQQPRKVIVVQYEAPAGIMQQKITAQNSQKKCRDDVCWLLEAVSIPLPESLFHHYADLSVKDPHGHWSFTLLPSLKGQVAYTEFKGLYAKVNELQHPR